MAALSVIFSRFHRRTRPKDMDAGAARFTHMDHACKCHRNVILVYVTLAGAQVTRYGTH